MRLSITILLQCPNPHQLNTPTQHPIPAPMNKLFVDNLTVMDFSYLHAERGLLGESWIVDIELLGELDAQGMVFDFGHVKKTIKRIIDEELDHKLVIARGMPELTLQTDASNTRIDAKLSGNHRIFHVSPTQALALIDGIEVTKAGVIDYLSKILITQLPKNVKGLTINLRDEIIHGAFYHYSHGLKKHDGNCQRIAHGHRSKLEIYINDQRDPTLENLWASTFKDIYIGTHEDLIDLENAPNENCSFAYIANQGEFKLSLPSRSVYLINTDSTVEWIATHIAEQIKAGQPSNKIKVKAFEGVGKGAIAEA